MGEVIQLRPRRQRPGEEPENPPVLVPDDDPDAEPDPAAEAPPVPDRHRRLDGTAIQAGIARWFHKAVRWLLYQLFVLTPKRGLRCLRWFRRGVAGHRDPDTGTWSGGWVGLLQWCFAARERADARKVAAEQPGGLTRATEHANRLSWWHSAALVVPHVAGALLLNHLTPVPWWAVFAPLVVATIIHGHHHDPKPPAPIAVPPERGDITKDLLNDALRAVGVLPKPTTQVPEPPGIQFAAIPRPVGIGRRLVINLPASVKAAWGDVVRERSRIAASLALPEAQFYLEQGQHAGQVVIWHADRDPYAGPLIEHPLYNAKQWDVWEPAPFGHEPWGTPATQCLVFSSILVAARPRRGKSYAARSAVLPGVLDPHVRFYVWNLKGDEAWDALKPICEESGGVYGKGRTGAQLDALAATLEHLCDEMDERNARVHGSKLTRDQARDRRLDVPVTFIVIDEVQRALTSELGDRIAGSLIDLAKNGPSSGLVVVLATQRSGADVFPTDLRASMGARFALHVLTWRDSDIILGDGMATDGYDASDLPMHKGVGILRPDDDADDTAGGDDPRPARTVRVYDTGDDMWSWVCAHGLALRRQLADADTTGETHAEPAPEYATPSELFKLLTLHAPNILDGVNATDAHAMGMRLPIKTEPHKVDRRRVYDLRRVELSLHLTPGCLGAVSDLPPTCLAEGTEAPPRDPGDTPESGGEAPSETPHLRLVDAAHEEN